jgi:hemerythrin-like domain-containing protein
MQQRTSNPGTLFAQGEGDPDRLTSREVAATYRSFLAEKKWFCDRLETLADLLPDGVNNQDCLHLAQIVVPLVMRAHAFEEQVVFPYLAKSPNLPDSAKESLERLKYEHFGDEAFAHDLCISLREYVTHRDRANPETLSWMMRGFFDGVRRHVAFEQALLLPLIEAKTA